MTNPANIRDPRNLPLVFGVAAIFIYALSVYVPLLQPGGLDLNTDWLLALNVAHLKGLAFGRDVQFTYGPLGFAWAGYFPGTFPLLIAVWTIIAALVCAAMFITARRLYGNHPAILLGPLILLMLLAGDHSSMHDVRLIVLPFMLLAYHFCADDRPISRAKTLLLIAITLAGLIKFTYLLAAGLVCAAISLDELIRHRRPLTFPILALMYLVGWSSLGQKLSALLDYFRSSINVAGGYSEAMAGYGNWEASDERVFIVLAFLLAVLVFVFSKPRERFRKILHAGTLLALLFLVFKAGYVRPDEHEIIASCLLPCVACIYVLIEWKTPEQNARTIAWASVLCASIFAASATYSHWAMRNLATRTIESVASTLEELIEVGRVATGDMPQMARQYEATKNRAAQVDPLPAVTGTTDLFQYSQHLLIFNGLDYSPRPSLLAYAAYTPELAEADAKFLRGSHAPENIFFAFELFNDRMPALEEGPAMLEILARYDLVDRSGHFLQFRKSSHPRHWTMTPIEQREINFAQSAPIPRIGHGLIWAEIDVAPTHFGKLISTIYKPQPLEIQTELTDGREMVKRFIAGCGRAGFILSPPPHDNPSFLAALDADSSSARQSEVIASIRIEARGGGVPERDYGQSYHLKLYSVEFSP